MAKKSFRKIPKHILSKLKDIKKQELVAVAVICLPKPEILKGNFKKFGISYDGDKLIIGGKFLPRPSFGKYSRENKFGKIVVRRDLPKINKTFSMEVPNYGDWGKGSHDIEWDRLVYRREKIEPKNLFISSKIVADKDEEIVMGFEVDQVLDKSDKNLQNNLLFCLNLLQENFGVCDVISLGEPLEEKKSYKKLDWEVLPPGWWADINQVHKLKKRLGSREAQLFIERLKYIDSLNPLERYEGESYLGNRLYYVFIFKNHALAECPIFGNAVYILDKDKASSWQEIFAKTKREVLRIGVTRVLHKGDWKKKLMRILS